jgi:hypothetical protein
VSSVVKVSRGLGGGGRLSGGRGGSRNKGDGLDSKDCGCIGGGRRIIPAAGTGDYEKCAVATKEESNIALTGFSAKFRNAGTYGSSSMSSRRSPFSSRCRRSSGKGNSSYSSATQYVAMRPLAATLKDARDQEAAIQLSMVEDGDVEPTLEPPVSPPPRSISNSSSTSGNGISITRVSTGSNRIAGNVPRVRSDLGPGRVAPGERDVAPLARPLGPLYVPERKGRRMVRRGEHGFSIPARNADGGQENVRSVEPTRRTMSEDSLISYRNERRRRLHEEQAANQEQEGPSPSALLPPTPQTFVGSSMSSAGTSRRPDSNLSLMRDQSYGRLSGRRGESGSLIPPFESSQRTASEGYVQPIPITRVVGGSGDSSEQ